MTFSSLSSETLNAQQVAAVSHLTGKSLIIAGAGTGKTHTLVHKVIRTLESGVPASQILLLTFTNKAAAEMTRRVEKYLGHPLPELMSGTFHSVSARFLRQFGRSIGVNPGFTILDTDDAKTMMAQIRKDQKCDTDKNFPKKNVLYEMQSFMRNCDMDLSLLLETRYPDWRPYTPQLRALFQEYRDRKKDSQTLDFDDLLDMFYQCLANEETGHSLQEQYTHVFVDEFQDTNKIQNDIIQKFCTPETHLTVVGDDAQSIYSFRGARLQNILDFDQVASGVEMFPLEINYRSTTPILKYANAVIAGNLQQFPKQLRPDTDRPGPKPHVIQFHTEEDQCRVLGERIQNLIRNGVAPESIAVLYRAHSHSMKMQIALSRKGIPFTITSGLRFFEQAHVKDVMAPLKVLYNPREAVSWMRLVKLLPGVGDKTALKIIGQMRRRENLNTREALEHLHAGLPAKAKMAFREIFPVLQELAGETKLAPGDAFQRLLEPMFFYDHIRTTYENSEYREEDLEQLMDFAKPYEDLETFLAEMTLASERYSRGVVSRPVLLTTVHQAKGLEWDHVFVVSLAEGRFPSFRTFDNLHQMEEERRLFYVAVTRARKELVLTFPVFDENSRTGNLYLKPSRFLVDMEEQYFTYQNMGSEYSC